MEQADVRIGAHHDFAVQFQHQAQHAVRRRMLRTEVEGVVPDVSHGRHLSVIFLAHDARRHFARLDGHGLVDHALLLRVVAHFDIAGNREILAEGMADETVVGQDAAQIGMAFEMDAEQVEGLALVPVGDVPDIHHRFQHRKLVVGRRRP
jgi:hypothetical protein